MADNSTRAEALRLSVDLVGSYVQRNDTSSEQLIPLLQQVYSSILNLAEGHTHTLRTGNLKPAVPIDQSVFDDYIVCLEDGKKLQMLKRHLKTVYNMTVEQYKERWNLPSEYPSVSPNYAKRRSEIAKTSGLGQTGRRRRFLLVNNGQQ